MSRIGFRAPGMYWQGVNEIDRLGPMVEPWGRRVQVIASQRTLDDLGARVDRALAGFEVTVASAASSCTFAMIDSLVDSVTNEGVEVVVGIGGGSTLDTTRAVAHRLSAAAVCVPTVVSTDAPTAAASVIYAEDGSVAAIETYPVGPAAVLVDTEVIRRSPRAFVVSGFGDALATAYEVEACQASKASTVTGGRQSLAARAISERCREVILTEGRLIAAETWPLRSVTAPLDAVIEANTLLSGIGFESGGLAGAHAIHNGLAIAGASGMHGERVGYGLLVHLALLGLEEDLLEVAAFLTEVGLPTSLRQLNLYPDDQASIEAVARRAVDPSDSMSNMPRAIGREDVIEAIGMVERRNCR